MSTFGIGEDYHLLEASPHYEPTHGMDARTGFESYTQSNDYTGHARGRSVNAASNHTRRRNSRHRNNVPDARTNNYELLPPRIDETHAYDDQPVPYSSGDYQDPVPWSSNAFAGGNRSMDAPSMDRHSPQQRMVMDINLLELDVISTMGNTNLNKNSYSEYPSNDPFNPSMNQYYNEASNYDMGSSLNIPPPDVDHFHRMDLTQTPPLLGEGHATHHRPPYDHYHGSPPPSDFDYDAGTPHSLSRSLPRIGALSVETGLGDGYRHSHHTSYRSSTPFSPSSAATTVTSSTFPPPPDSPGYSGSMSPLAFDMRQTSLQSPSTVTSSHLPKRLSLNGHSYNRHGHGKHPYMKSAVRMDDLIRENNVLKKQIAESKIVREKEEQESLQMMDTLNWLMETKKQNVC